MVRLVVRACTHCGPWGRSVEGERFCRLDDPGRARTPSSELPKVVPAMAEDGDEQVAPNLE